MMKRYILLFYPIFLLLFLFSTNLNAKEIAVRSAIDFGSGSVKIQTAVVDVAEKGTIIKSLFSKYSALNLTEDVAKNNGFISEEMQRKALSLLNQFKDESIQAAIQEGYSVIQFSAIATAVFRKAQNGIEILQNLEKQLGIRFQILSQDDEGKLGYMTAKSLYPETLESSLLSWDSGNGSFQITLKDNDNYYVYQGPLGHGTVRVLLARDIRNGPILQPNESGNPISKKEAIELKQKIKSLLPPVPDCLNAKLKADNALIATFGDGESIFALTAQAKASFNGINGLVNNAIVKISDVQKVIDAFLEKNDEALKQANLHYKTLTSALLLAAVMEHFDIESICYRRSIGNTSGMLISPDLWKYTNDF